MSQSDPHAFPTLGAAVRAPLYADADLYLHVEPGHYVEREIVAVTRRIQVVPTRGPGTVEVSVGRDTNVFRVRPQGHLELYGVRVRGDDGEYPPVYVDEGARFTSVDCVFASGNRLGLNGRSHEVVNCRFEGSGVRWSNGGGTLRDSVFENASLYLLQGASPRVENVRFHGAHARFHSLFVSAAAPVISDCELVDCGTRDSASAVWVEDGATPRFTGLSVRAAQGWPVRVRGKGTRAEFTRLRVDGGRDGGASVYVWSEAEATLDDAEVRSASTDGVSVSNAAVTFTDLVVEGLGGAGLYVEDGRVTGRGLRIEDLLGNGINLSKSRARLEDVVVRGHRMGAVKGVHGIAVTGGRSELKGVRAESLVGGCLGVYGAEVSLEGLTGVEVHGGIMARDDATVEVRGLEISGSEGNVLHVSTGSGVNVSAARISDCAYDSAHVKGARLVLRSSTVTGSRGQGVAVDEGGVVTIEDTEIRDGAKSGLFVADAECRARLLRCRVTGHKYKGVEADAEASVHLEETELADNKGGDDVRARASADGTSLT
ncbi:right-handed parallel beta-helix repeat-containing protein, partial [Nocardiopsis sp. MG754419]|uniref:right-handed parallel beta-helix repeat-containing protein n=1 Tax=Nocardiopsis sp. MG754419 TaxID=2259865 RepID=UPI001BA77DD3